MEKTITMVITIQDLINEIVERHNKFVEQNPIGLQHKELMRIIEEVTGQFDDSCYPKIVSDSGMWHLFDSKIRTSKLSATASSLIKVATITHIENEARNRLRLFKFEGNALRIANFFRQAIEIKTPRAIMEFAFVLAMCTRQGSGITNSEIYDIYEKITGMKYLEEDKK